MDSELEQQLFTEYPMFYDVVHRDADTIKPPHPPLRIDGIACGDGWYHLIESVSAYIESELNDHPDRPTVHATQIKQKWGGLRIYANPTPELAYGAFRHAEYISKNTCESCGTTTDVTSRESNGWRMALCPSCDPPVNY